MTTLDQIRALAAQRISYHGVVATIGRQMTSAEATEYYRTRTAAQLRAAKERADKAKTASEPEPFSRTLTSIGAKFDLDSTLENL